MDASQLEDQLNDAVELVNHETRARILVTLAAHNRESPRDPVLPFTELRERIGHEDPGNFNYHLQQLTGRLVKKSEEGYQLSDIGGNFVGLLLSGQFDPDVELEQSDLDLECPICGTAATVEYCEGTFRVACDRNHEVKTRIGPEVMADRSVEEAVELVFMKTVFDLRLGLEGLCPNCNGLLCGELAPTDDVVPVVYEAVCDQCGLLMESMARACVLDHPAVVSMAYDHGFDVRTDVCEMLAHHVDQPTLLSEDPLRVEVTVTFEDDEVALLLDASAEVVSVDETRAHERRLLPG